MRCHFRQRFKWTGNPARIQGGTEWHGLGFDHPDIAWESISTCQNSYTEPYSWTSSRSWSFEILYVWFIFGPMIELFLTHGLSVASSHLTYFWCYFLLSPSIPSLFLFLLPRFSSISLICHYLKDMCFADTMKWNTCSFTRNRTGL